MNVGADSEARRMRTQSRSIGTIARKYQGPVLATADRSRKGLEHRFQPAAFLEGAGDEEGVAPYAMAREHLTAQARPVARKVGAGREHLDLIHVVALLDRLGACHHVEGH